MNQVNTPIALCVLDFGRTHHIWAVLVCPCCGHPHDHGGGSYRKKKDPREFLGGRRPHCTPNIPEGAPHDYTLVECPPHLVHELRLIARLRNPKERLAHYRAIVQGLSKRMPMGNKSSGRKGKAL